MGQPERVPRSQIIRFYVDILIFIKLKFLAPLAGLCQNRGQQRSFLAETHLLRGNSMGLVPKLKI